MEVFQGEVTIHRLLSGAREAEGLAVIIDVFRAFSLECWLYAMGAREIRPVGEIGEALAWRLRDPDCLLVGERGGAMVEGFDFGNSPSTVDPARVAGRRVIHTTSAGTQGLAGAARADTILTGSLVNARAVAEYIERTRPAKVSLVAMGRSGREPADEDELCAEYIRSLLLGRPMPDFDRRLRGLATGGGRHFFDPDRQSVFPRADFGMCTQVDKFPFALRVERDGLGLISRKIDVT